MPNLRRILFLTTLLAACLSARGTAPEFVSPSSLETNSEDGTVSLAWTSSGENAIYEVRRSEHPDFRDSLLIYEGGDTATFVSGLPEGVFHIKLRSKAPGEPYSAWPEETLVLKVEYIDPTLVAILMSAGAITFIAIILAITIGHRRTHSPDAA